MGIQKGETDRETDKRISGESQVAVAVTNTINSGFRYGAYSFMAWCAYLSINALAGHHTAADIVVKFLGNISVSNGLAYALGGSGLGYGALQHWLKKTTVKSLEGRIHQLEGTIDPNRTSSQLTTQGETNPEDLL